MRRHGVLPVVVGRVIHANHNVQNATAMPLKYGAGRWRVGSKNRHNNAQRPNQTRQRRNAVIAVVYATDTLRGDSIQHAKQRHGPNLGKGWHNGEKGEEGTTTVPYHVLCYKAFGMARRQAATERKPAKDRKRIKRRWLAAENGKNAGVRGLPRRYGYAGRRQEGSFTEDIEGLGRGATVRLWGK